jgi:hypothetical protein
MNTVFVWQWQFRIENTIKMEEHVELTSSCLCNEPAIGFDCKCFMRNYP